MSLAARNLGWGLLIALVVAALDQASKWKILAVFRPPGVTATPFQATGPMTVAPVLDFTLTWNRGISFGVGNTSGPWNTILFGAVAVIVAALLIVWMSRARSRLLLLALGLVVGGAAGNLVDRLHYGAVVDFLYVHVGAFDWWPAFNLADSAICVGAALLVMDSLFGAGESHKNTL